MDLHPVIFIIIAAPAYCLSQFFLDHQFPWLSHEESYILKHNVEDLNQNKIWPNAMCLPDMRLFLLCRPKVLFGPKQTINTSSLNGGTSLLTRLNQSVGRTPEDY